MLLASLYNCTYTDRCTHKQCWRFEFSPSCWHSENSYPLTHLPSPQRRNSWRLNKLINLFFLTPFLSTLLFFISLYSFPLGNEQFWRINIILPTFSVPTLTITNCGSFSILWKKYVCSSLSWNCMVGRNCSAKYPVLMGWPLAFGRSEGRQTFWRWGPVEGSWLVWECLKGFGGPCPFLCLLCLATMREAASCTIPSPLWHFASLQAQVRDCWDCETSISSF